MGSFQRGSRVPELGPPRAAYFHSARKDFQFEGSGVIFLPPDLQFEGLNFPKAFKLKIKV